MRQKELFLTGPFMSDYWRNDPHKDIMAGVK
jgi:hypothetical protein